MSDDDETYGIADIADLEEISPPDLPYKPKHVGDSPPIALIGTGGIAEQHLTAYRDAGYDVRMLCNRTRERAEKYRETFYPDADVTSDYHEVLERDDIPVVDVLPHPVDRAPILEDALEAGKHVLSQKPFVVDLEFGERLVELADERGVALAVNQNGRWAPHWSYIRHAIAEGLIGDPHGIHCSVDWDHNWIAETEINAIEHAVLYDFAVHWFDIVTCFMGDAEPKRVYASYEPSPTQQADPPLLGQAVIEYENAQATLSFDADTPVGPKDRTTVVGTDGTIRSEGPDLEQQSVTLYTAEGYARPDLEGTWFPDGFHGAMAELLSAIDEGREPSNSARNNLRTLELCYAAVASAEDHEPVVPGSVRQLRGE
ncbi:Gfo/Idh/MocA family oxidoreductase [Natronolimnobius sp. AArcel1]|uniref:Gfo/Idh/MocA family protein n=1 Tax=Natronolimnobius sp. AArcel1 TaxID=1679093 RepID=UPI0013EC032D|nr:Gfo/Idh/MocA family oxidoreductase [Natronolimnobius sp. AArcel1]NGM70494.1 Gfo/Idh/MocA family oxidoreductase [Natronolimnobius sp. AArcel1]